MKNIIPYSSVLHAIANNIPEPDNLSQGAVMETILVAGHCKHSERITARLTMG